MGRGKGSANQLGLEDSPSALHVEPSGERNNDLGEVNGYPVNATSKKARRAWKENICPFLGRSCPKANAGSLPSCSILHNGELRITCPHRLMEAQKEIEKTLSDFFSDNGEDFTVVSEVTIPEEFTNSDGDDEETSAGRADLVFVEKGKGDDRKAHLVEVQTEYISGNISKQIRRFLDNPDDDNQERAKKESARPDSLSSSFKRLFPQILRKGTIFSSKEWGEGKIGVVTPRSFFDSFSRGLPRVSKDEAEVAWVVCDIEYDAKLGRNKVFVADVIYTTLEAIASASVPSPGKKAKFLEMIDRKISQQDKA